MNLEIFKCQMFRKHSQDKEFSKFLKDFVVTFVKTRKDHNGCISISPQPFKLAYSRARVFELNQAKL